MLFIGISTLLASQTTTPHSKPQILPLIQGETYLVIGKAVPLLMAKLPGAQISRYDIQVMYFNQEISVIFQNKNHPPDVCGNPGPLPEFSVTLDSINLKVLHSEFVR